MATTRTRETGRKTSRGPAKQKAGDSAISPGKILSEVSRGEYVYRQLRSAIQEGRYKQGDRIREQDVAKLLNVSRTPVREALRRLQTRGLLEFVSGQGLNIIELNKQQVLELYAMRELLEGAAARLAAQHATLTEIMHLRDLLHEFSQNINNPNRLARINRTFHRSICDAAHNRYMQQSLDDLGDALALLYDTTFSVKGRPTEAAAEHTAIVDAIERRDPDSAEKAAREHIKRAQRTRMQMLYMLQRWDR